mgnify:CR=1 FL=1
MGLKKKLLSNVLSCFIVANLQTQPFTISEGRRSRSFFFFGQIPFTIDVYGCIKHDTALNLLYYSCWNVWNTTVGWHRQKDLILTMGWQYQKEEDPVLNKFPLQIPFTIDMCGCIKHDTTLNLLYYSCWNVWNTTVGWHRQKDLILTMEWQYQKEEDPVLFFPRTNSFHNWYVR